MREKIKNAIDSAADRVPGYQTLDHKTGFVAYLQNGSVGIKLPCLWLCPLELTNKTGRNEGTKTYSGVIYVLDEIKGLAQEQKDSVWDRMESSVIQILNAVVGDEDIICVENIKCAPDEYALTGYQTISMSVHFDVKISYCENSG